MIDYLNIKLTTNLKFYSSSEMNKWADLFHDAPELGSVLRNGTPFPAARNRFYNFEKVQLTGSLKYQTQGHLAENTVVV